MEWNRGWGSGRGPTFETSGGEIRSDVGNRTRASDPGRAALMPHVPHAQRARLRSVVSRPSLGWVRRWSRLMKRPTGLVFEIASVGSRVPGEGSGRPIVGTFLWVDAVLLGSLPWIKGSRLADASRALTTAHRRSTPMDRILERLGKLRQQSVRSGRNLPGQCRACQPSAYLPTAIAAGSMK